MKILQVAAEEVLGPAHYPLHLGASFLSERGAPSYASVRYDFKPATLGGSGTYRLQQDGKVSLQLPASNTQFTGKLEACKGDLECVAIFDGTCWRLEVLSSTITTKFVRDRMTGSTHGGMTPEPAAYTSPALGMSSDQLNTTALTSSCEQEEGEEVLQSCPTPPPAAKQQAAAAQPAPKATKKAEVAGAGRPGAAAVGSKRSPSSQANSPAPKHHKPETTKPASKPKPTPPPDSIPSLPAPSPSGAVAADDLDDAAFDAMLMDDDWGADGEEQQAEPAAVQPAAADAAPAPTAQAAAPAPAPRATPPPSGTSPSPRKPPAPLPPAAATQPSKPPVAPAPAKAPAASAAKPTSTAAPPRAPAAKATATRTASTAKAVDEWGFEGMDDDEENDDDDEEEEEAQEEEEEEEDDVPVLAAPAKQAAAPAAAPAPARPPAPAPAHPPAPAPAPQPAYHDDAEDEEEEDDDDDDAHLRCSDDEASDGLGLEDGLC